MKWIRIVAYLLTVATAAYGGTPRSSADVIASMYGDRNDTTLTTVTGLIGARTCRLIIDSGDWYVSNNLSIATNITVCVEPGARFNIVSGKTLTLNGPFEAGRYEVFTGSGTTAGSPKLVYRFSEWGDATTYPMGSGVVEGVTNALLSSTLTVSGAWSITNDASVIDDITVVNLVDKTATETISGVWTHSANVVLDDGTGDSPTLTLTDGSDATLILTKADGAGATIVTSAGDITLTPGGTEVIIGGGLSVGTTTAAGDNNIRLDGHIYGQDGVSAITNMGYISCDVLNSDGTALTIGDGGETVAVNSSDWDISTAGVVTGLGSIGCDGDITLTHASAAGNVIVKGYTGYDAILQLFADAGASAVDKWYLGSRASDNDFWMVNGTTTNLLMETDGDMILTGDLAVNGDDITCDGDLTITPAGGDAILTGTLTVSGNITGNGNVIGDGSTIVTNMASVWSSAYYAGTTAGMTYTFTNVIWTAGTKTGNWTFVNGLLTAHD